MPRFQSAIDPQCDAFADNRAAMLAAVETLRALEARAEALSEKRRARFEERGQLTPRERLAHLLDPGMAFLELFNLANYLLEDDNPDTSVPGGSVIIGIGFVSGVRCLVWVDDSGIKAGAATKGMLPKILAALDIAAKQKLPVIHCVESAGMNLMTYEVEGWSQFGKIFYRLGQLSAAGIPNFVVLHGPSTAGGAYMPGMADVVVGVASNGMAALAGAALVKSATGEVADEKQLGGAPMHASVSGLVEYLAEDDAHAIAMVREAVAALDWNKNAQAVSGTGTSVRPPAYPTEDIAGVTPKDHTTPYDVHEVIARIVDGSDIADFKPGYGPATVCATAQILGHAVGLIGNNGPLDPNGATKAAQFIQLCDQADRPVIFLNNTTGFIVGTASEQAGMIKHGSKLVQAVSNMRVPKISLYIGSSFGAGNYGMCGFAFQPDFIFAWPTSRTGVMGGAQAAKTMSQVTSAAAKRRGEKPDAKALRAQEKHLTQHFDRQSSAFYTSGRVLDHGVIDPRDTRRVLGFVLDTCAEGRARTLRPNAFGVARL